MTNDTHSSASPEAPDSVLFLSTTEGLWGGSEILWSQAALALARRGIRVGAFFPYYKDIASLRTLASAGVALFFGSERPTRWWRRLGRPKRDRLTHFKDSLQEFKPRRVICNQGAARDGVLELAVCRARGVPYSMLNQAVEPLHYGEAVRQQLRETFEGARRIWCVSSENLTELRHFLSAPLAQAEVIPNAYGCDFDVTCPWPPDETVARVAVVARLEPEQKAQDLVLQVLALERWRNRALHVTFFGTGPAQAQLETLARELALANVTFAGQAEVGQIWRSQHALLLPSHYEGQSLAMIEAMLHGRPVIATPVGGTAGVVVEGQTGYLANSPGDTAALDAVLERAWLDRANWARLGAAAGTHIRNLVWRDPGAEFARRVCAVEPAYPHRSVAS